MNLPRPIASSTLGPKIARNSMLPAMCRMEPCRNTDVAHTTTRIILLIQSLCISALSSTETSMTCNTAQAPADN